MDKFEELYKGLLEEGWQEDLDFVAFPFEGEGAAVDILWETRKRESESGGAFGGDQSERLRQGPANA